MSNQRNKGSAVEINEQIYQVREWINQGKRTYQICRMCAEQYGLSRRTAESRIQAARRQQLTDIGAVRREELAAQMIETLQIVIDQGVEAKQGNNVIGALRLLSELTGLQQSKAG